MRPIEAATSLPPQDDTPQPPSAGPTKPTSETVSGSNIIRWAKSAAQDAATALIPDFERQVLLSRTEELRATQALIAKHREVLSSPSSSAADKQLARNELQLAQRHLARSYGYTGTGPAPGALWLDGRFLAAEVERGVDARRFPVLPASSAPPSPLELLDGRRRPLRLAAGEAPIADYADYRQRVAHHRQAAGTERTDGTPIPVHVSMEGGGGKGKQYGAALGEMLSLGIVPCSASGASAGSIAAALVAAGADGADLDEFAKSPALKELYDVDAPHLLLKSGGGGFLRGGRAYQLIDEKLRELTGIEGRPVTFADLKMPLQVVATVMEDSAPPPGKEDLRQKSNRIFVFSQETTPNTPVALAVRASMAIPGVFEPVRMLDVATGRQVTLTDGGVLDNLPMGYQSNRLPVVGLSLQERGGNQPDDATPGQPLPGETLKTDSPLESGFQGYRLFRSGGVDADDYRNRNSPKPGEFMLALPTWNLSHPAQETGTLSFGSDARVDGPIATQTRALTRSFFQRELANLERPGRAATNLVSQLPQPLRFQVSTRVHNAPHDIVYDGGNSLKVTDPDGSRYSVPLGQRRIEAMCLDGAAFGGLDAQLALAVEEFHLEQSLALMRARPWL